MGGGGGVEEEGLESDANNSIISMYFFRTRPFQNQYPSVGRVSLTPPQI